VHCDLALRKYPVISKYQYKPECKEDNYSINQNARKTTIV